MKRILINGTQSEELRVAIVDGQKLYNLDIEVPSKEQKKSSIYKGIITRVEQSLEAAFVDFGGNRHGFLPFKEISENYYSEKAKKMDGKPRISDAVKEGLEVIVQIEKEERGNKGAALTTKISLAGRYLVLMPTESKAGGVSRRIEGEERSQVRETMDQVTQPENMGCIVRTAGVGRSAEEMQWDIDYLLSIWSAVETVANEKSAPFLIYQDSDLVVRALRDHYNSDIGEILIDEVETFNKAKEFLQQVMPHNLKKLKFYEERTPLFNRFQIEGQIEAAFHREVRLPSGGAIVIDQTEALTAIDVNSGRATKGGDIEETALNTNLESAAEIARQLRLRDMGGLFVLDFIDMYSRKNQRKVEHMLKDALSPDRARVQVGRISRFGLLEMSRQRLRPSLGESSQELCPVCTGKGEIRSVESLALSVLRLVEEEASKESSGQVSAHLPIDVATYLLNEKREQIGSMEQRYNVDIILVPDNNYERPNYLIERTRNQDQNRQAKSSHERVEKKEVPTPTKVDAYQAEVAAVRSISPGTPAPAPVLSPVALDAEKPGIVVRLWKGLFATGNETETSTESQKTAQHKTGQTKKQHQNRRSQTKNRRPQNNQQRKKPNQNRKKPAHNNKGNNPKQTTNRNKQQNNQKNTPNKKSNPETKAKPANDSGKAASNTGETDNKSGTQSRKTQQKKSGPRRGPGRRSNQSNRKTNDNEQPNTKESNNRPGSDAAQDNSRQQGRNSQAQDSSRQQGRNSQAQDSSRQQGRNSLANKAPKQDAPSRDNTASSQVSAKKDSPSKSQQATPTSKSATGNKDSKKPIDTGNKPQDANKDVDGNVA